jgi:hypothetical protein
MVLEVDFALRHGLWWNDMAGNVPFEGFRVTNLNVAGGLATKVDRGHGFGLECLLL